MNRIRPNSKQNSPRQSRRAFSMVELLVVIAVIGVLVAMLLPAIQFARARARYLQCTESLRQIGLVSQMYRDTNHRFPNKEILGGYGYRMAPGLKTPNDPWALPEKWGLEALFVRKQFLPPHAGIWVCPGQEEVLTRYANTYAFSVASAVSKKNPDLAKTLWVWDNYTMYPGQSGVAGSFMGYTIPVDKRTWPHPGFGEGTKGYNGLFLDGHVEYFDN